MDRRVTPSNGRVAHVSLRGSVAAQTYVEGVQASVCLPVTDICAAPAGARDRQLVFGDPVLIIDSEKGWSFIQSAKDGYCGWVEDEALTSYRAPTHRVTSLGTHIYPAPDFKQRELGWLTFASLVTVTGQTGRFAEIAGGGFVPALHLGLVEEPARDPAAVASLFLGTPYLWGGNSRMGLDCSGLVQVALLAAGIDCPGDSDLQEAAVGVPIATDGPFRRNDLLFWKGHVALVLDSRTLIHANAFHMAVAAEDIGSALSRIAAQGGGMPRAARRVVV